jgi:simple sugar transport system ATP-binding protein
LKAVEFKNITKTFGNFRANDDISFSIEKNSIHCILGENGAGKSTLMKVLFGSYKKDSGEIYVNENPVNFKSPLDAIKSGIGMLYQHFMLIEDFTILENVILGSEITAKTGINYTESKRRLNSLIDKYKLDLNLDDKVSDISIGAAQKTELLKLLYRDSEILIFDEPTAVLSPIEVENFFKIIRNFKEDGKTIILITHKLNEVKEIADEVSVLRKGKLVYSVKRENLDIKELGKQIIGDLELSIVISDDNLQAPEAKAEFEEIDVLLSLQNITLTENGLTKLFNINLDLHKGEILGVCGVEGNGQSELIELISGLNKNYTGLYSKNVRKISLVPDDRLKKGMIKEFSIGENLLMRLPGKNVFSKRLLKEKEQEVIAEYDVRVPEVGDIMENLSGGNQQKAIVAREIKLNCDVIIFSQPTRGVDIKASSFIHQKIYNEKMNGKGILLVSADLDELLALSDRLAVLFKGKIVKIFAGDEFLSGKQNSKELIGKIGQLMIGMEL